MSAPLYDTDLTDAAWALVAPVLPTARPGGRPRTTNLRAVLNAIFYLMRTGCQWRLLPREFPPWHGLPLLSSLAKLRCVGPSTSSALRAGPSSCRTGSLSIGGDHGWPIGQDDRAWWRSWFRRAQARKGTQTPHLGRHTGPTGCQPCRTG
jgi:transposase